MRLEFIRVQMEPCFRSGYHLIDYQRSGNLAPAHQYKLQKRYPYTRQQCLEPQSDGDEIEKQPKQYDDNYGDRDDESDIFHKHCLVFGFVFVRSCRCSGTTVPLCLLFCGT